MNSKYRTIHYYSDVDKCYLAYVPELIGCVADGQTAREAVDNVIVIADEWIETCQLLGRKIPKSIYNLRYDSTNPNILDVAKKILHERGTITTMSLQKLAYYCLAWSLAWYNTAIFSDRFQAWVNGPVNRKLFNEHQHMRIISEYDLQSIPEHEFSESEELVINAVLEVYGCMSVQDIINLTHNEKPWKDAREGLKPSDRSTNLISNDTMRDYYQCN